MALTRKDLDEMGCGSPGCGHDHTVLFLHCRRHQSVGLDTSYSKATGTLRLYCSRCMQTVCEIEVAYEIEVASGRPTP